MHKYAKKGRHMQAQNNFSNFYPFIIEFTLGRFFFMRMEIETSIEKDLIVFRHKKIQNYKVRIKSFRI